MTTAIESEIMDTWGLPRYDFISAEDIDFGL